MRAETKFVKPLKGLIVRDPHTKAILPADGASVPWIGKHGRFWRRRLKDGSIILAQPEKPKKPEKAEKVEKEEVKSDKTKSSIFDNMEE